jgi:hypothetical protein
MFAGRAALAPPGATTTADNRTRVTHSDRTRARVDRDAVFMFTSGREWLGLG